MSSRNGSSATVVLAAVAGAVLGVGPIVTGVLVEWDQGADPSNADLVLVGGAWFVAGLATVYTAFPSDVSASAIGRMIGPVLVPCLGIMFVVVVPKLARTDETPTALRVGPRGFVVYIHTAEGEEANLLSTSVADALFENLPPTTQSDLASARRRCVEEGGQDACEEIFLRLSGPGKDPFPRWIDELRINESTEYMISLPLQASDE